MFVLKRVKVSPCQRHLHARAEGRFARARKRFGNYDILTPSTLRLRESQPRRSVGDVQQPPYAETGEPREWDEEVRILSKEEQDKLHRSCQIARDVLLLGKDLCKPGITTEEIDRQLHEAILSRNAYPSPLNYMHFPKSICTSVNNVIAHGIPDGRSLRDGDIINIDITVFHDGFHGDTSATFHVGDVDQQGVDLVQATQESLDRAISICGPGVPLKEIGRTISEVANRHGFQVSTELSGHGIGREFHSLPLILHHINDEPGTMESGMAFTIEPILCQGSSMGMLWPDKWTISTVDGGRSTQFEHTILVHDDGVKVLTR